MKKVFGIGAVAVAFTALLLLCRKKEADSTSGERFANVEALNKKYAEEEE